GELADFNVSESDKGEHFKLVADRGDMFKKRERFIHFHFEDVVDAFPFIFDGKRLAVEAIAAACLTLRPGIFHEIHVDFDHSHTAAAATGALFDVKAKASRLIAARAA